MFIKHESKADMRFDSWPRSDRLNLALIEWELHRGGRYIFDAYPHLMATRARQTLLKQLTPKWF